MTNFFKALSKLTELGQLISDYEEYSSDKILDQNELLELGRRAAELIGLKLQVKL